MSLLATKSRPNLITRRNLMIGGASLILLSALPNAAEAAVRAKTPAIARRLALENLHTGERLKIVYWEGGTYVREALSEINHIMRDYRTNQVKSIDPRLLDVLHRMQALLDTHEPYQIVSGYRSPKTNARLAKHLAGVAKRSLHVKGKAIDIRLENRSITQIHRAALSLHAGGVGYYPKSGFVHVDVGRVRTW